MDILQVKNLTIREKKNNNIIVDSADFSVKRGGITCIVGESGSGKTMIAMSIIDMLPEGVEISEGDIVFENNSTKTFSKDDMRKFRGRKVFSIFQNSINCFNPWRTMKTQVYDMVSSHYNIDKDSFENKLINIMKEVNLKNAEVILDQYPFQLSGGMLQKMMIAAAIIMEPDMIIADEPTTALDLVSQKEILTQFKGIKEKFNTTIFMITHDFGVVAEVADDVVVMKNGRVVEKGNVYKIFDNCKEEYTKELINTTFFKNSPLK